VTGFGLDDRGMEVRVPLGSRIFSSHIIQTGFGTHPASYPMGTRSSFPGVKAAGAWNWPLTFNWCQCQENVDLSTLPYSFISVLNYLSTGTVSLFYLYTQSVGLLGRRISSSHSATWTGLEEQNKHRHLYYLEWDSDPRSQCLSGRRHFMPRVSVTVESEFRVTKILNCGFSSTQKWTSDSIKAGGFYNRWTTVSFSRVL
jgi:hypothetical protein